MIVSLHARLARLETLRRALPVLPLILIVDDGLSMPEALAAQPEVTASWIDADARLPRMVIA